MEGSDSVPPGGDVGAGPRRSGRWHAVPAPGARIARARARTTRAAAPAPGAESRASRARTGAPGVRTGASCTPAGTRATSRRSRGTVSTAPRSTASVAGGRVCSAPAGFGATAGRRRSFARDPGGRARRRRRGRRHHETETPRLAPVRVRRGRARRARARRWSRLRAGTSRGQYRKGARDSCRAAVRALVVAGHRQTNTIARLRGQQRGLTAAVAAQSRQIAALKAQQGTKTTRPTSTTQATTTQPEAQRSGPLTTTTDSSAFGDGTYQVGVDIQAGEYADSGGARCSWAKLSAADANGGVPDVLSPAPTTVVIDSPYFASQGCGVWRRVGLAKSG